MNRMAILSLTAKAIDATGSLFNLAGVPCQVVVNNVSAITV
jgi:hypothetical protein